MRRKTAPACVLFRIPPSSCGGQFRGTSGVTFIRALRGQFTQEFPHLGPVDYVRRITGPKMKNESGDMGHRRGPDAGRSALGPFEEGPKAGEMALEATKGRSARARFSQGGREEGWTLAGKCLAGGPMYEHRMDDGGPKAWKSTDAESRHLRSEATQGVWGVSPPMHEMPLSQNGSRTAAVL